MQESRPLRTMFEDARRRRDRVVCTNSTQEDFRPALVQKMVLRRVAIAEAKGSRVEAQGRPVGNMKAVGQDLI